MPVMSGKGGGLTMKHLPHPGLQPLPPCSAESPRQVSELRLKEKTKVMNELKQARD